MVSQLLDDQESNERFARVTSQTHHSVLMECQVQQLHLAKKGMEMFYLTTHSIHFIYGYMALQKKNTHQNN